MTDETSITTLKEAGLPLDLESLTKDAGMGSTKMALQDLAIPFLYTLHSLSPQCNRDNAKYIVGANPGMMYLSVVEKVFDTKIKPLEVVFCYYERKLPEWKPREKGGGIVTTHSIDSDIMSKTRPNEKGIPTLLNGNNVIETAYNYVLVGDGTTWYQALMPLKSTGLKVSRKLNSLMATLKIPNTTQSAPRFLYKWNLTTLKDQKDDMIWYNPMLSMGDMVDKELYGKAKSFCEIAMKGIINTTETEEASSGGVKGGSTAHLKDDDIPF
jgi:hypothetical protein